MYFDSFGRTSLCLLIFLGIILKWIYILRVHIGQSLGSPHGLGVKTVAIFNLQNVIHEMDCIYLDY